MHESKRHERLERGSLFHPLEEFGEALEKPLVNDVKAFSGKNNIIK